MAITNHLVAANSSDFATDLGFGINFIPLSQTADSDTTGLVYEVTGQDAIINTTPGDYEVTYSADDDDTTPDLIVQTVTVLAASGTLNTAFDAGNENRDGSDTTGTVYDATVDLANAGTIPSDSAAGYFDESALDPYEVANS